MSEHCPTCGQPVPTCSNCGAAETMVMGVRQDGSPSWRCLGCDHWEPRDDRWPGEATTGEIDQGWPARPQARG